MRRPRAIGSDGCESTGAIIRSSTIIPSANPPLKHMPIAPTPGPPTSAWRLPASARNHAITGAVRPTAHAANSRATHIDAIDCTPYSVVTGLPGVPTNDGITTVNPASTTSFANCSTRGVMPGTSWITTTPGPAPRRRTSCVMPAAVKLERSHPGRVLA